MAKTTWSIDGDFCLFILPDLTSRREPRTYIDHPITMVRIMDKVATLTPFERRTLLGWIFDYEMNSTYPVQRTFDADEVPTETRRRRL